MTRPDRIIVFQLNEQRYALPLATVERVVRMVEITPLPGLPAFIHGVINAQGKIIPVLDLRRRLGLPGRPISLEDQMIIIGLAERSFALIADSTGEVREYDEQTFTESVDILPDLPFLAGIVKLSDGMILLQNPDLLLSASEIRAIDKLVEEAPS